MAERHDLGERRWHRKTTESQGLAKSRNEFDLVPRKPSNAEAFPMNAVNVIAPYKHHGMWVFDDPRVGLVQEPFGADAMIDRVVADLPDAEHGFTLIFSGTPFPGHQYRLDWRRGEGGGNWYYATQFDMEGWLCPALFKYFQEVPKQLYVQIRPSS
jgi:hypothetical protein